MLIRNSTLFAICITDFMTHYILPEKLLGNGRSIMLQFYGQPMFLVLTITHTFLFPVTRYDRNKLAAPGNMDFTKVDVVNYAFFQTDTNGNIWGTDSWGDPNVLFGTEFGVICCY